LKDSGLIPNDKEENPPANISSSDEISSKAIRNLHSETLLTCIQALQNTTVEERYFSTITLNINPIDIPRIKNFIRKFEDEFEKEFETKPGEEVYSLNINFIPMTKKD